MENSNQDPETKPVAIAIVGTGSTGTGDGGIVPSPVRMEAVTPGQQPNLFVKVITPVMAILIRAIYLFLVTFSAILSAEGLAATGLDPTGVIKNVISVADFKQAVMLAAWLGFIAAFLGTVKNLVTIFGQLEGKYPLATGSI